MLNIFKKETPDVIEVMSNINELVREGNDFFSDELILLDEKLTGNLFCAERVVIEQHGVLSGNITSKTCVVSGVIKGDITSLDLLEIKGTAIVMGNIQSASVNIDPGAVINGYITVGEDIDALTHQWNKTKFSTDDYLSAKSAGELPALNNAEVYANTIKGKEEKHPWPVDAKAQSPAVDTQLPEKIKEEDVNNQRWW